MGIAVDGAAVGFELGDGVRIGDGVGSGVGGEVGVAKGLGTEAAALQLEVGEQVKEVAAPWLIVVSLQLVLLEQEIEHVLVPHPMIVFPSHAPSPLHSIVTSVAPEPSSSVFPAHDVSPEHSM